MLQMYLSEELSPLLANVLKSKSIYGINCSVGKALGVHVSEHCRCSVPLPHNVSIPSNNPQHRSS